MTLLKVALPPGLYRNGTKYQAYGRWYDGNLVRFVEGTKRPIGGWTALRLTNGNQATAAGTPRGLLAWRANDNVSRVAVATTTKLYVYAQGVLTDITPTTPTALTTGNANATYSVGNYGAGAYGAGVYGVGDPTQGTLTEPMTWQLDNFGEDLVACATADGKLWYWDRSAGGEAAVLSGAPTSCVGVVVTPERFIVALGAGGDGRTIQWASQETTTTWTAATTNSAGDLILDGRGNIMCGRRARSETLIWTESDLWAMQYIGGTLVYRATKVGAECGPVSRLCCIVLGGATAFWMGARGFFMYDGFTKPLPCEVQDYVFSDFNVSQRHKVTVTSRARFGEVIWYYPSASSTEIDRYVTYNYREGHWCFGQLSRTADVDRVPFDYPIAITAAGLMYEHENGWSHGGDTPYLESGPYELGDGTVVQQVLKIIPDETTLGDVSATVYAALYPTATESSQAVTLANPTDVRLTGRQIRLKLTEASAGDWRVGDMRVESTPAGRR